MYKSSYEKYINAVVKNIRCNRKIKKKIKADLLSHIQIKAQETGENDPWKLMGDPYEVAKDFGENLGIKEVNTYWYEYISETRILGWPLVHINTKRNGLARGIIAVGGFAVGVISIGGVSLGLFSIGGMALGLLFALGGFSASLQVAVGAFAISYYLAIGAAAIAKDFAVGAYAQGKVVIGDTIKGIVGIYKTKGTGHVMMNISEDKNLFFDEVRKLYPKINSLTLKILKYFARLNV